MKNEPEESTGIYYCKNCNSFLYRKTETGKPHKKWIKTYCEKTGKNTRVYLRAVLNE